MGLTASELEGSGLAGSSVGWLGELIDDCVVVRGSRGTLAGPDTVSALGGLAVDGSTGTEELGASDSQVVTPRAGP